MSYSDVVTFRRNEAMAVLRDHKTKRKTGTFVVPISGRTLNVLTIWLEKYRPLFISILGITHDNVFFNLRTGKKFESSSFSKFLRESFNLLLGLDLNAQKMRRIFAAGILIKFHLFRIFFASDYLDCHPENYQRKLLSIAMLTSEAMIEKVYSREARKRKALEAVCGASLTKYRIH